MHDEDEVRRMTASTANEEIADAAQKARAKRDWAKNNALTGKGLTEQQQKINARVNAEKRSVL